MLNPLSLCPFRIEFAQYALLFTKPNFPLVQTWVFLLTESLLSDVRCHERNEPIQKRIEITCRLTLVFNTSLADHKVELVSIDLDMGSAFAFRPQG